MHIARWSAGDQIVLRFVGHDDGVLIGHPQIVVEDSEARVVLFQPAGRLVENHRYTPQNARSEAIPFGQLGNHRVLPATYEPPLDLVRVIPRDAAHAIELHFAFSGQPSPPNFGWTGADGALRGIKINLQTPLRRTAIGFDTTDNSLDVVMRRDLRWSWKDLEQMQARVAGRLTYPAEAAAFIEEAVRVIAAIEHRRSPFSDAELEAWAAWTPDQGWPAPSLPSGWHEEPGYDHDLNRRWPIGP